MDTTFSSSSLSEQGPKTALEQARSLTLPPRQEMLLRSPTVTEFWNRNDMMLEQAWVEWSEQQGQDEETKLESLDDEILLHPTIRQAFEEAWKNPSKEYVVQNLWKQVAPGVYTCQLLDPAQIYRIRQVLARAASSGIPARPPHGIVLNRNGFMLDPNSVGYLAIPQFQIFYRTLIDKYMRPLGRLLFPEYIQQHDDVQSFGFTIQYQPGKDQSIRQHTDASSLTLNINLNLPTSGGEQRNDTNNEVDEERCWTGSSLYFVDDATGRKHYVDFAPGVAIVHRGHTAHAALPITSGERSNMVLWLFGKHGHVNTIPYPKQLQMTKEERWTMKPPVELDDDNDENDTSTLNRWFPF